MVPTFSSVLPAPVAGATFVLPVLAYPNERTRWAVRGVTSVLVTLADFGATARPYGELVFLVRVSVRDFLSLCRHIHTEISARGFAETRAARVNKGKKMLNFILAKS